MTSTSQQTTSKPNIPLSTPPRTASVPVPSPHTERPQYFGSLSTMSTATTTGQAQLQQPSTTQETQTVAAQQTSASNFHYVPDRTNAGTTAHETVSYINNYALVAEAAKRAQMGILMRDMEGVELA